MRAPSGDTLPDFLTYSTTAHIKVIDLHLSCALIVGATRDITVEVSGDYTEWNNCECVAGYYGHNGHCVACPPACPCTDNFLTGCYPSKKHASAPASAPVLAVLPCPRYGMSIEVSTPCNPTKNETFTCADGHDPNTFMCSKCSDGFFITGYVCNECTKVHTILFPILYATALCTVAAAHAPHVVVLC